MAKKWPCGPSTAACLEYDIISCHQTLRTLESTAPATFCTCRCALRRQRSQKKGTRPEPCWLPRSFKSIVLATYYKVSAAASNTNLRESWIFLRKSSPAITTLEPSKVLRLPRVLHFAAYVTKASGGKPKPTPVLLLLRLQLLLLFL